jgi:hypothetical protein
MAPRFVIAASSTQASIPSESGRSALATSTSAPDISSDGEHARLSRIPAIVSDLLFFLLVGVDIVRTLRHAMWRDELQAFMLALGSSSLWDLFLKIRVELHPGLWYTLVWLLTRVTSDPMWMQVMQIGLAVGAWIILYRFSPFGRAEKVLILLSYYLFWEYFVLSRSYVLLALIGFAFVALRQYRPQQRFIPWMLLGLLANVHVIGAIWSMALGALLALQKGVRRNPAQLAGVAIYLALFGLAIATLTPADYGLRQTDMRPVRFNSNSVLGVALGAFVPIKLEQVRNAFAFLANPDLAPVPQFWNANPIGDVIGLMQTDTNHPLRLALAFLVPIAVCWLITLDSLQVLEFFLVYTGVLLFTKIWQFTGDARMWGILFLAFIASVWTARVRRAPAVWSSWLFGGLLAINAFGGLFTLASEVQPFSQARNTATWLKKNNLADAFLIGSKDSKVSSVAGYLGRPVYYLECECSGTFVIWNRRSLLSPEEFGRRLARAVGLAEQHDAILIRDRPVTPEDLGPSAANISLTRLETFAGAFADEQYWIYRASKTSLP